MGKKNALKKFKRTSSNLSFVQRQGSDKRSVEAGSVGSYQGEPLTKAK